MSEPEQVVERMCGQDSKDVFVLGSIEDITVALEDSLVTISTIEPCRQADPSQPQLGAGFRKVLLALNQLFCLRVRPAAATSAPSVARLRALRGAGFGSSWQRWTSGTHGRTEGAQFA